MTKKGCIGSHASLRRTGLYFYACLLWPSLLLSLKRCLGDRRLHDDVVARSCRLSMDASPSFLISVALRVMASKACNDAEETKLPANTAAVRALRTVSRQLSVLWSAFSRSLIGDARTRGTKANRTAVSRTSLRISTSRRLTLLWFNPESAGSNEIKSKLLFCVGPRSYQTHTCRRLRHVVTWRVQHSFSALWNGLRAQCAPQHDRVEQGSAD